VESAAARALQAELESGEPAPLASRSHGRGLVAAAIARPPVTCLGVDVEWIDPRRRMDDIAGHYLGETVSGVDAETFFRGWTFGEAWFKAFGRDPSPDLIRAAGTNRSAEPLFLTGAWLVQSLPEPGFVMSLVWRD
jgi:hypothetical protein